MSRVADSQPYACPFCDRRYANPDTIVAHCGRDHGPNLNSVTAIYGRICPACNLPFDRLSFHASREHHRMLPLLWADVQAAGDPHRVIERRLKRFAAEWLVDRGVDPGGVR